MMEGTKIIYHVQTDLKYIELSAEFDMEAAAANPQAFDLLDLSVAMGALMSRYFGDVMTVGQGGLVLSVDNIEEKGGL